MASSVGTHERTVTPASVSMRERAAPLRTISPVPTTSVAPAKNASQISSTEASKAREKPWYTRSAGWTWKSLPSARTRWQALRCSICTPLGLPVVPEV